MFDYGLNVENQRLIHNQTFKIKNQTFKIQN